MIDPYSPVAGVAARLVVAGVLCALVWAGVAWAMA